MHAIKSPGGDTRFEDGLKVTFFICCFFVWGYRVSHAWRVRAVCKACRDPSFRQTKVTGNMTPAANTNARQSWPGSFSKVSQFPSGVPPSPGWRWFSRLIYALSSVTRVRHLIWSSWQLVVEAAKAVLGGRDLLSPLPHIPLIHSRGSACRWIGADCPTAVMGCPVRRASLHHGFSRLSVTSLPTKATGQLSKSIKG